MWTFLFAIVLQQPVPVPSTGAVTLSHSWRVMAGDSAGWARLDYDDRAWAVESVPGGWPRGRRGTAWYRLRFRFDAVPYGPVGIRLRSVVAAYEVFLDGERLGGLGSLPPTYRARSGVPLVFALPPSLLTPGEHLLAVRVYSEESVAGLTGDVQIGALDELARDLRLRDYLLLAAAMLLSGIAVAQLSLWWRRPGARLHVAVALFCLTEAVFFVLWMPTVRLALAPWLFWYRPYLAFGAAAAAAFCLVLREVLELEDDRLLFGLSLCFVAIIPLALFAPTWGQLRWVGLYPFNLALLVTALLTIVIAIRQAVQGAAHARTLLWGILVLVVALLHDVLVQWGAIAVRATFPWLILTGCVVFAISLVVATGRRFLDTETAALYDRLTGLYRREVVMDALQREIRRAARMHQAIAVIMLDVDRFKQINDTLGHQAGDRVLAEIGRRLGEAGRAVDWLGRYGGEEFVAVLAATSTDGAVQAAERLRQAVAALPIATGRTARTITLSAGVAAFDGGAEWPTTEQLVGAADAALYRAKNEGRNRVAV